MSYQVPQHIEKNKVFIVSRSEIEGRLDPKMILYNRKVQGSLYPKVRLKNLLLCKPQYGASEPGIARIHKNAPRYIRITDIDEYGLLSQDDLGATANVIEEKYILCEDDILIARSGATVGKSYIHKKLPYQCFYAGYLIRFVIDPAKALPDYVFSFTQLNTYKEWVGAIQRPSGQPNINAEEYQSLEIPLPDICIQSIIANKIREAYSLKSQKDLEVQQLLDSINSYLLEELCVSINEPKTDIKSRLFIINRSALEGRLDPSVYKDGIKLVSEKYDNVKLSSCAWINPNTSFKGKDAETPISFIPMEVIDECYSEITFMSENLLREINEAGEDAREPGSTEFFVIRPRTSQLSIDYLQALLHMKAIRKTAMLYFGGSAGQQRVSVNFLENFNVPLPPIEKQEEIAHHVAELRQKAKALQQEGRLQLEKAKQEVEQMIIG